MHAPRLAIFMFLVPLIACGDGAPEPADSATGTGGEDDGDDAGEGSGGDTADTADPFCEDQPVVTYANFGRSFMTENCQGCHASTANERYGAPASVAFDTVEDCWSFKDRILARSASEDPDMPPSGGVFEDDRQLLQIWLLCADSGS